MNGAIPLPFIRLHDTDRDNFTVTFTQNSVYCQCIILLKLETNHRMKIVSTRLWFVCIIYLKTP